MADICTYYKYIYPYELLERAHTFGLPNGLEHREISLTFRTPDNNEIYMRNKVFQNSLEWKNALTARNDLIPLKCDFGAIYNTSLKNKDTYANYLKAVEKELVFDIDLTDYDEIRTCCSGKEICRKCWKFMSIAMKILELGLKNLFGYEQIIWIFSGRRGVHGWISDPECRGLPNGGRAAIAEYLNVSDKNNIPTKLAYFYDSALKGSYGLIKELVESETVDVLSGKKIDKYVKPYLRWYSGDIGNKIKNSMTKGSAAFFSTVFALFETEGGLGGKPWSKSKPWILALLYNIFGPRLDLSVTADMKHLIKSPFACHPATMRIAVPIRPEEYPLDISPTVSELIEDLKEKGWQQGVQIDKYRSETAFGALYAKYERFYAQAIQNREPLTNFSQIDP